MQQKQITLEKIEILTEKIKKTPTVNSIFYFVKVLKKCLSGADNNEDQNDEEQEFLIEDTDIFDIVLKFGLSEFPQILKKLYLQHQNKIIQREEKQNKEKQQEGVEEPKKSKLEQNPNIVRFVRSKKMEIILKVFLNNFYKFFSQLHEDEMILFVLKKLPEILDLMYVFPPLVKKIQKLVTELWATSDVIAIKLHAFISLRKIAMNKEDKQVEEVFRKTYVIFVKNCKNMNWRNYELVIFMINCFNELLSINFDASYFVAFSYLRQIAVALKEGLTEKKKDSEKKIYNWEILNSLRVWVSVLCKNPQLNQLIYPLVELIQGLINYHRENEYIPTHLHLIRMLIDIQEKTGHFIPIIKYIKQYLTINLFQKKLTKPSKIKPFDFVLNTKMDKKYAKTSTFWNEVFKQLLDLSVITLAKFAAQPEAPEMAYNYIKFLTRLGKSYKFVVFKMQIKETINTIRSSYEQILPIRMKSSIAPNSDKADQPIIKKVNSCLLVKASQKLIEEYELKIKQKIASEKEGYYDNKNDQEGDDDDEDISGEEDYDEGEEGDEEDQMEGEEDDDNSYDFEQDLSDKEDGDEEDDDEEAVGDLDEGEEIDYEGDPEEYNSEDFDVTDEEDE